MIDELVGSAVASAFHDAMRRLGGTAGPEPADTSTSSGDAGSRVEFEDTGTMKGVAAFEDTGTMKDLKAFEDTGTM